MAFLGKLGWIWEGEVGKEGRIQGGDAGQCGMDKGGGEGGASVDSGGGGGCSSGWKSIKMVKEMTVIGGRTRSGVCGSDGFERESASLK